MYVYKNASYNCLKKLNIWISYVRNLKVIFLEINKYYIPRIYFYDFFILNVKLINYEKLVNSMYVYQFSSTIVENQVENQRLY